MTQRVCGPATRCAGSPSLRSAVSQAHHNQSYSSCLPVCCRRRPLQGANRVLNLFLNFIMQFIKFSVSAQHSCSDQAAHVTLALASPTPLQQGELNPLGNCLAWPQMEQLLACGVTLDEPSGKAGDLFEMLWASSMAEGYSCCH